jgi:hypothetical protein
MYARIVTCLRLTDLKRRGQNAAPIVRQYIKSTGGPRVFP